MRLHSLVLLAVLVSLNSVYSGTTRPIPCTLKILWLDVAVTIVFSSNMGVNGIVQAVSDISSVFYDTTISQNIGSYSRVALLNYTYISNTIYPHNHFYSTSQFESELWNIIPMTTTAPDGYIANGLESAAAALQTGRDNGQRNNVPQVIMVYASDYTSTTSGGAALQASRIKSRGITIIVIDNSNAQNISGLADIASPGMVFLTSDLYFVQKVQAALCSVNSNCPAGWVQVSDKFPNGPNKKGECVQMYMAGYDRNSTSPYYWIGLSLSSKGVRQWDQMPGKSPIPMTSTDYSAWYPGFSASMMTPSNPNVNSATSSGTPAWFTSSPTVKFYSFCQINTCDTDKYCS